MGNDLVAHSNFSGTGMVQVSENLDAGNTLRRKINPSPALIAGGSRRSPSVLPNYRMSCWMMFLRTDVMSWMGYKMGKGVCNWL